LCGFYCGKFQRAPKPIAAAGSKKTGFDYSKWDNIEDSDEEVRETFV
jgi:hypothetical protein